MTIRFKQPCRLTWASISSSSCRFSSSAREAAPEKTIKHNQTMVDDCKVRDAIRKSLFFLRRNSATKLTFLQFLSRSIDFGNTLERQGRIGTHRHKALACSRRQYQCYHLTKVVVKNGPRAAMKRTFNRSSSSRFSVSLTLAIASVFARSRALVISS